MVAMVTLCEIRIRYIRLLIHIISGDLIGGVEEIGELYGRCYLPGVVDIVQSTCVIPWSPRIPLA
jgi:hypothetical protein